MTYAAAIQFLYGLQMFGAKPGLERTTKLCELAGNPERKLRFIHVAGTNGKGSTCAILESIYRAAGFRVGLFTSPHLVSFRERIQINRQFIPETEVARLAAEQIEFLKTFSSDEHPTMFEVVTVMAVQYFAEQKCDLVILETGLGGRLDATNVVTPLASVITSIGLDHQQWLGDTLEKIAAEKAGIIKRGVPMIAAPGRLEINRVFEAAANANAAPLTFVTSDGTTSLPEFWLGEHQRQNVALAIATTQVLQLQFPVTPEALEAGIRTVTWPGRMQLLKSASGQQLLLDGAHNEAGVAALLSALRSHFPSQQPTIILGILNDKSWQTMANQFASVAKKIMTVPVASARTVPAGELADACRVTNSDSVALSSLAVALNEVKNDPFVLITGSLYLVGEALELLGLGPEDTSGERGLNEWKPTGNR